jgi:hypothetical protein
MEMNHALAIGRNIFGCIAAGSRQIIWAVMEFAIPHGKTA